jgi:hypothetical protein
VYAFVRSSVLENILKSELSVWQEIVYLIFALFPLLDFLRSRQKHFGDEDIFETSCLLQYRSDDFF